MDHLIKPYGGHLQNLLVDEARVTALKSESQRFPAVTLSRRQLCDLELLINGGFSPLRGFLSREAYEGVLQNMRLPQGLLWPLPIYLDVPDAIAKKLEIGGRLGLCDTEGFMLAVLNVEDIWGPDKKREAELVYGTNSLDHPGVRYLHEEVHNTYVGGQIEAIQLPLHYDFESLRYSPNELRSLFKKIGWNRVVAFHISKPMHRLHRDITLEAAKQAQANILIHAVAGVAKPGDLDYIARVHCYQAILKHYPPNVAMLSLLPHAMRMAGPRGALQNAIIRQNYGCTHYMVGYKQSYPPGADKKDEEFYPAYASQKLCLEHQNELDIQIVPVQKFSYVPEAKKFLPIDEINRSGYKHIRFTQTDLSECLRMDQPVPDWYSFPDVMAVLRKLCPPRQKQGFTLFFTGLSGAGKSTLAKILYARLVEMGGRPVTLLDGDVVRQNLSSELGFSRKDRDINVRRIGFVAGEISKNGGIAICAPIAPYASTRRAVREKIEQHGAFIEIHVATPLDVCESRDRKGLYAKARKGLIPEFTGISDPYEAPENPEIRIDTSNLSPIEAAQEVLLFLSRERYLDFAGESDVT